MPPEYPLVWRSVPPPVYPSQRIFLLHFAYLCKTNFFYWPGIELYARLGDIRAAYVIGDYAKGSDSGLIDLVLVGQVDDEKLKEMTAKTEKLINRKIRTLVLDPSDLEKLNSRLDIEHALFIWGNGTEISKGNV